MTDDNTENGDRIKWRYGSDYTIFEVSASMLFFGMMGKKHTNIDFSKVKGLKKFNPNETFTVMVKDGEYITFMKKNDGKKGKDFTALFTSGKMTRIEGKDYDRKKQVESDKHN